MSKNIFFSLCYSKAIEWPSWVRPSSWLTNEEMPLTGPLLKPRVSCHSVDLGCFFFFLFFFLGGELWGPNLAVFRDYPRFCLGMGPGGAQETMCCLQHAKHAPQPHLNSATPWATFSRRPVLFDFNSFQLSFSFMSGKSTSCRLPGGDRLHPAHQEIFLTPRACWAFFVGL